MKLNLYEHGKGKDTVVLLHSGGETALTENEFLRDKLSNQYKVISLDLRGHGKSPTDDLDDYFNKCANDVLETLDTLNIKTFHIIGASIGALISIFIYLKNPDRIQSIILSGITMKRTDDWMDLCKEDDDRLLEIVEMDEVIEHMNNIHEGDWKHLLTHEIGKDWYPFEQTRKLENIHVPTLICIGENAKHELASIHDIKNNENIHLAVIPFSGHLVSEIQPEIYSQIVMKFLSNIE